MFSLEEKLRLMITYGALIGRSGGSLLGGKRPPGRRGGIRLPFLELSHKPRFQLAVQTIAQTTALRRSPDHSPAPQPTALPKVQSPEPCPEPNQARSRGRAQHGLAGPQRTGRQPSAICAAQAMADGRQPTDPFSAGMSRTSLLLSNDMAQWRLAALLKV